MHKLVLSLTACVWIASAQSADNPLSASTKGAYNLVKNNVVRGAEKMPEENYEFKPTPEVRSFGQLIGHIADANYMFCSTAQGEKSPGGGIEKSKTSKADLVAGLKESYAYCDKVYDAMTDAAGSGMVKFFGREMPKLGVLNFNNMHDDEHYGNMVTYLRIKGIVPPSSERRQR